MADQPPRVPIPALPTAPLPWVVLARELTPVAARAAVRTGALERIRPGGYRRPAANPTAPRSSTAAPTGAAPTVAGAAPTAAAARELALARIAAISRKLRTPFWFSHESAALVWGCPLWTAPASTHLIQTVRPSQHSEPLLTRHLMSLALADRQEWRGVPLTSLDRTVVDCLRRLPPLDALVIADGALRLGADRAAIAARLGALAGRRGIASARTVFEFADGRAESAWETFVRYVLVRAGLPRPEVQVPVHPRLGWFRADLGWDEWKLLVEFDGFTKYSTLAGGDPAQVVFEKKRRQDAIQEENWVVLRATAADARRPSDLVRRVCRRLPPEVAAHLTPIPALRPW